MNFTIKKREGSPDFVIGSFGFKLEDVAKYVNAKGYINFDILKGQYGNYVKVNEYKPKVDNGQIPY